MDMTNKIGPSSKRKYMAELFLFLYCLFGLSYSSMETEEPSLGDPCVTSADCRSIKWEQPYPVCDHSICTCADLLCEHRTSWGQVEKFRYFCATCGSLGSVCNSTDCAYPGTCEEGYCECRIGKLRDKDLCFFVQPVVTTQETIILFLMLVLILFLSRVVSSWSKVKIYLKYICRCNFRRIISRAREGEVAYGYNPESGTKSAAYTISNSDFLQSTNDPDLEWALELSRMMDQASLSGSVRSNTSQILRRDSFYRSSRRHRNIVGESSLSLGRSNDPSVSSLSSPTSPTGVNTASS